MTEQPTPAETAAPIPVPAPRLIPPEAYDEPLIAAPPAPVPEPRPEDAAKEPAVASVPPVAGQPMAAEEVACRVSLRALGVAFAERPPVSEASGCAIAHPIAVTTLSSAIRLEPEALMNCATAEAAARFTRDVVAPAAKASFGADLVSVQQASAYVCRPRNGTTRLSEHAFGNALDFGAFVLADGRVTTVESTGDAKEQTFLTAVRKGACGPFRTVLGPGSDADHATHFHFDLAPRKSASAYCR